ncbi:Hypothetical predicted protein [Lynx pardinus]|uniref:Uncharacterized protein n=1 Tax=Lynx pardinus TaxID=191816 RepID=A0A485P3R5_LYNPA|nr:Hypothetical predicted protein [Lynx pardinus]
MSGKHYKGPEVSCCIKYFIFGFNVIFWPLGRLPEQGEAFAFRLSSLRVGEINI